jgi:uncharacterized protein (UPF0335 family)
MTQTEAIRIAWVALHQIAEVSATDYEYQRWANEAITAIKTSIEENEFNPDWDTQAVLVEEIQRMAKRIEELEAKDKPMHPEIKKLYEDYFDKCFRESSPTQRTWVGLTDEEMQRMAKRIEELETELKTVQYKYGPMAFQIYLPTYQAPALNNAKLPWVYDQDRSSGNVASMWVTPVARMGANGPKDKHD